MDEAPTLLMRAEAIGQALRAVPHVGAPEEAIEDAYAVCEQAMRALAEQLRGEAYERLPNAVWIAIAGVESVMRGMWGDDGPDSEAVWDDVDDLQTALEVLCAMPAVVDYERQGEDADMQRDE
jgi:hypothetical protein